MSKTYILIPGRTSQQGVGINEGKFEETYQSEISVLQVALDDMEDLGLEADDFVRVTSEHGEICLLYTSPSPRDAHESRMPSSA